ncbi:Nitroimidazol reductase NimA, pyridoxamine 5'-phosphate oxidase superfamily [Cryobacterium psychrotolerans]|uniref:Nitroimidazol reductase NimA, pyridoxamine 5'-phosphate oxidase superfamily n=1 Tax=Cryobacterium psychrotolerans TaxID=386301 RepID=A0A1G9EDR0_9MICO|nr:MULTISPECIES: pyridoxamine 5'-phosphate oxidase family protein [Cryobacterium]SDK74290.1 Nitroimidazol reductase NimA, pyridoxamine 5'-phosphate oxidase superfamily [Cryobacterium psychrotolerans]
MAINDLNPVEILSDDECWEFLLSANLGRLAVSVVGEPDIYPVNFVASDKKLLFRTSEGEKLLELTVNNKVAFESDGVGREQAWSVVVKGTARVLETRAEIDAAEQLPLRPLVPTLKYIWVEITPARMSGRRFTLGPEPERF